MHAVYACFHMHALHIGSLSLSLSLTHTHTHTHIGVCLMRAIMWMPYTSVYVYVCARPEVCVSVKRDLS